MLCNHTVPKTCPQLDMIEHGSVEVFRFSTWHFARYTCDVGYKMRGFRLYRDCDLLTGEWDRTGEWGRTAPICEECKLFKCSPQVYLQGIT